ncbi:MAG: zinc-finger domain-containing protein [Zetaproteobacteria bacterium CG06_land_8_20_14_3_00_59_53]|nr:MAG: hypothetical protein COX56_07620 [Zetaproteobacteria bacterium CG23_combo_of_CG06-09_8_20_14_all_59_86]PIQ65496.1 MAG: hypothetical protein COV97_03975 [Zetaproteobacteria bacterium CG11_big_fil_rev_8_21_14_0_20_59_439]PIU69748.1 MAG: zinc-finger domain-containing protein [Zetaproteobacteria bacterium CG06_land_8_20_14_3_00_59_53]PIU96997.1 MAG: zinc-finger domain-containing protein [Zetaproteobacteria bacterium CG03_land_8_20_14_0_80_59_51]PIY47663.1 MAG: zinc-finger domain-containing 
MTATIKVTEPIVSCSDNGQHPLVYINLKNGSGRCQYCGKSFVRVGTETARDDKKAA